MTKEEVASAIAKLEGSIATIDIWLWIFGAVVAIGVVGEAVFGISHLIKDSALRRLRGTEALMHEKEMVLLNNETMRLRAQDALTSDALLSAVKAGRDNAIASEVIRSLTESLAVRLGVAKREQTSEATRALYI